jgi:hypothetical protein
MNLKVPDPTLTRVLEDGTIALDTKSGHYYVLNEVGGRMWVLMTEGKTTNGIIDTIVSEFEVSHEQVRQDLQQLTNTLEQKGLLVPEE